MDADLSWGDVLLQNMTIDSAVLKLSDGDVDLTGSQIGTLNAELDYGDIEGDHVSCTTLSGEPEGWRRASWTVLLMETSI